MAFAAQANGFEEAPVHSPLSLEDAADSLTLAVIASSHAPLVLLDGDFTVIAASTSFCNAFELKADAVTGRPMAELGSGEWNVPQLDSLLTAIASGNAVIDAYEMDLALPAGGSHRLVINARKLDYGDGETTRVLLSVADVTQARLAEALKDDILREKGVLLQELQHRVANSLQIIASVLMQSARRVQSEETRSHLFDAHQRVMSIAALQKQLAVSKMDDVELRTYFGDLCRSIGASMIGDQDGVKLNSTADGSVASADVSVSLGLIVTELVINALKHAFPEHRAGIVSVAYMSQGPAWTLSVGDDGIGMPGEGKPVHVGLGTSIVEALAKKLGASVDVSNAHPGTVVKIVHP